MEMDNRKITILQAIIDDYINTAEPVGSRTIAKKYDLGISSATIRNEMADLEDMGYIEQLHSSSGRKPSDKGYRLYVDKLMKLSDLSPNEVITIKTEILNTALFEVEKMIRQASTILAELTKLTCIVKTPSVKKSYLKSIQLLNIDNSNVLSVIITDSGIIKNTIIKTDKPIGSDMLTKLNNLLNQRLKNLTVEEINLEVINNLKKDLSDHQDIFNAIIPALYDSLSNDVNSETYLEGATNIFNYPEFNDIDKAREFLGLINDKYILDSLFEESNGISIRIGNENEVEAAKDCSIISASYNIGNRPIGCIGIIGPTRIQYSKVIPLLSKVIKELNDAIRQNYIDDR